MQSSPLSSYAQDLTRQTTESAANEANPSAEKAADRGTVSLPHLLVGILLAWAILDVAGRIGPIAWLDVIPELVAARRSTTDGPFAADFSLHGVKWIGETAVAGNLAPTETRPPITFSTDGLGFRLTPGLKEAGRLDCLVTGGASFTYGGGLSDDETFPSVLTRDEHIATYNGGRYFWDVQHFVYVDRLLDHLGPRKPSTVVYLYWENSNPPPDARQLGPLPWKTDRLGRTALGTTRYDALRAGFQNQTHKLQAAFSVSPLEVLSTRLFKIIANGAILPNPYLAAVESRTLPDGKRLLLLEAEPRRVHDPFPDAIVRQQGEFFESYAARLAVRGIRLDVVLLPNKYTLYGPLLDGRKGVSPNPYLARVEADLIRRHISVLNGLTVLRPYAESDFASGELSYFREDHHWTPKGVRRIAAAYAAFVRARTVPAI